VKFDWQKAAQQGAERRAAKQTRKAEAADRKAGKTFRRTKHQLAKRDEAEAKAEREATSAEHLREQRNN
jgi:hypothetical protein